MLNPDLYHQLVKRFGEVRISNEGQRMITQSYKDPYDPKTVREQILDAGEYYRICCPYCNDARFRLYVNYRWNTRDRNGNIYGKRLIYCFNEDCNLSNFEDELQFYIAQRPLLHRPAEMAHTVQWKEASFPGTCVPLNALPLSHPAMRYLVEERRFDPYKLYDEWNLHFCVDAPDDGTDDCLIPGTEIHARLVRNRIIIPIYRLGVMVGWQARAIVDGERIKYYTMPGFKKSAMVYNGDRAKTFNFGVVVEGVFDAFRVGPRAVALFGKKMSHLQRELVQAYWQQGGMCVMLDPDATEDMERMTRILNPKAFSWGAFTVSLPPPFKDPAEVSTESLWALIASYARTRGVPLTTFGP